MYRSQSAYLIKGNKRVVLERSEVEGLAEGQFMEVTLYVPLEVIKGWAEEIELLGLDDEDDF